jgi:ABC-type phosphate transport system substrate-binding protein
LLIFGIIIVLSAQVYGQDGPRHAVVVNSQNTTSEITQDHLARIMLGEQQRWPDGSKVKLAFLKSGSDGADIVSEKIVKMNGHEFSRYWLAMVFQGRVSSPNYFNNDKAIVAYIDANVGAIGVCIESTAKDKTILLIDGKSKF